MQRTVRTNLGTRLGRFSDPARGHPRGLSRLVGLDEALDGSVVCSQPQHSTNCGGNQQIALDVAQAPDKDLEPTLSPGGGRGPGQKRALS